MKLHKTSRVNEARAQSIQVISFVAGGVRMAFDIDHLRGIVAGAGNQPASRLPKYVTGAMLVNGSAVPVIDLGARLGLSDADAGGPNAKRVVIVCAGRHVAGLAVDAVSEIAWLKLHDLDIARCSPMERIDRSYIRGIGCKGSRICRPDSAFAVLEVTRILDRCADSLSAARASLELASHPAAVVKQTRHSRRAA